MLSSAIKMFFHTVWNNRSTKSSLEGETAPMMRWSPKLKRFEGLDKSFYKKGIQMLEQSWNDYLTLEGHFIDEQSWILLNKCYFIGHPTNLLREVISAECEVGEVYKNTLDKIRSKMNWKLWWNEEMDWLLSVIILRREQEPYLKIKRKTPK